MKDLFPTFPDDARLWVYPLARPLSAEERRLVDEQLASFVPTWTSHGAPVQGGFAVAENRFVLVAAFVEAGMGGCSTDSMVRVMKQLREAGIDGFDRTLVFFRDSQQNVQAVKREDFQALVNEGRIDADSIVFDPTIQFLGDLRRGAFETTFAKSWHARTFV